MIRAGVRAASSREVVAGRLADLAMALFDGLGVRAMIDDPAMDVDPARLLVARALAPELGVEPDALLSPRITPDGCPLRGCPPVVVV